MELKIEGVEIKTVGYDGHVFTEDFHARRDPGLAPGWFVFARNSQKYGVFDDGPLKGKGRYTALVARPDVKARRHPHYNGTVRRGWKTKAEAQAIADRLTEMNEPSGPYCPFPMEMGEDGPVVIL